jgi:RNA polymerase sigma factor (sigma-70 family)
MPTDLELLQRYVDHGSQEAFGELVRRHVDLVYSSALRRVGFDAHLAEDVTQEVFAELARRPAKLLDRPALEGWLYTTSRFKAVDAVRRASRRRMREALLMNSNPTADPAEPDWERLRPIIDEALDSLSKADGELLILRYFRNRSFPELARTLSLSEDAARMRSARALDRLRAALARRGIKSTAEALGVILANSAIAAAPVGLAARVAGGVVALAKGGTSAAGTALQAANATKTAAGVATLALLLASVATAVHEARAYRTVAAVLARTERENAATDGRLRTARQRLNSDGEGEAQMKSAVAAILAEIESAKARRAGAADKAGVSRAFSAAHPGAQGLIVGHDMAHNAEKYSALFASLGLGPEKQSEFLSLLARRSDLGLTWYSAPDTGTPSASLAAGTDLLSPDEVAARLQSLLGDDGFKAYKDFNRMGGATDLAQRLAGTLYTTDSPLSQFQAEQLVQILAQSSPDFQSGKGVWNSSQVGWDTALLNAQALLSAPQLDALRLLKQTSEYEEAMNAASNQAVGQALEGVTASVAAAGNGPL